MPTGPVTPSVKSFLIADMVFQMEQGKWCIIGAFQNLIAGRFPVLWPRLGLFVRLADAEGDYDVRIHFEDSSGRVISRIEGIRLEVHSRLATVDFGFHADNLMIPAPGRYSIKLYFNDSEAPGEITVDATHPPGAPHGQ